MQRLLAVVFVALAVFLAGAHAQTNQLPQETFFISVTADFAPNATGLEQCDYCNCVHFTCNYVYDYTCPTRLDQGADDAEQRWGDSNDPDYICFEQSGVGFQGVTNIAITTNPTDGASTRIGKITHYNNIIGNGASPTRLRLTLYISAPEFAEDFIIGYPLEFDETTNSEDSNGDPDVTLCDPGIQRTDLACDDIFVFTPLILSDSFEVDNRRYTLEIIGTLQPEFGPDPIRSFVTREQNVTTAGVYARIISFCVDVDCGPRGEPRGAPDCGCQCSLTEEECQFLFGPTYHLNDECSCVCFANETVCPDGQTVNPENCGCDCPLNSTYCQTLNPLFEVTTDPDACECVCGRATVLECSKRGGFWRPEGDDCDCVCAVSQEACDLIGEGYEPDFEQCLCVGSGGDGISEGAIAGAVIGSVAGAVLLTLTVLALAGLLVYLIRSGHIPGIYGYKVEAADMTMAQNSNLFQDRWTVSGNVAA